jgi:hypothetical protein
LNFGSKEKMSVLATGAHPASGSQNVGMPSMTASTPTIEHDVITYFAFEKSSDRGISATCGPEVPFFLGLGLILIGRSVRVVST